MIHLAVTGFMFLLGLTEAVLYGTAGMFLLKLIVERVTTANRRV